MSFQFYNLHMFGAMIVHSNPYISCAAHICLFSIPTTIIVATQPAAIRPSARVGRCLPQRCAWCWPSRMTAPATIQKSDIVYTWRIIPCIKWLVSEVGIA